MHSGHLRPDLSGLSHLSICPHLSICRGCLIRDAQQDKSGRESPRQNRVEQAIGDTLIRHRHTACPHPRGELEPDDQVYKEEVEKLWFRAAAVRTAAYVQQGPPCHMPPPGTPISPPGSARFLLCCASSLCPLPVEHPQKVPDLLYKEPGYQWASVAAEPVPPSWTRGSYHLLYQTWH